MEVFITSYLYPTMGSQGAVVEQLQHNEENQIRLDRDMGRNEQFSKEKGFILRETEKKYSFRDSNPRSMDLVRVNSGLPMNGHKCSVYQVPNTLFTNQTSVRNCHKRQIVNNFEQNAV